MTPADPVRILVAVPALNEAAHIEACIASLMAPEAEMARVRIVVVDGGSTDGTQARLRALRDRFPNLTVIDNPLRLQSAALNRVVATCAAPANDILVRCDAHSVYPRRYVLDVAESLLARDAAVLATCMDAGGTSGFQRAAAWLADARIGSGGAAHRGGRISGYVDHGPHAGFRLDWFRRVGGYDASFSHNEDAELDHRIALAGGRIWLDAGIRVAYSVRPTLAALARQYWTYGRGRARTVRKHRLRPRLRQMLPPLLVAALLLGLPLAPATPLALLPAAAYAAAVAMVSLIALMRMRRFCGLWAGPAMAAMHLAWGVGFLVETGFGHPGALPDYPDATVTASRRQAARRPGGRTVSG